MATLFPHPRTASAAAAVDVDNGNHFKLPIETGGTAVAMKRKRLIKSWRENNTFGKPA